MTKWQKYQNSVAALFRSMGFGVEIEAQLQGARARHQIDVLVHSRNAGIATLWIVECKCWKSRVRKEQVMTLAQIAQDVGADRAFLLSESGFQAGAIAACRHSNVSLTSLAELAESTKEHITLLQLRTLLQIRSAAEERARAQLFDAKGDPPAIIAADMGKVTDVLGACFDVWLAINAALTGTFPVTVVGILDRRTERFDEADNLISRLKSELEAIHDRTIEIEQGAARTRLDLIARADALVREVAKLLELTDVAFAVPTSESERFLCLASMKRIGDLSGELRDAFKGDLREKLAALMRSLIDGVYPMLTERKIDTDRWTATRTHTRLQMDQLLALLSLARRD